MSGMIGLHLGDCISVMDGIESGVVDLVVSDPPYKMTKRGKSCRPNYMPSNMGDNVFDGDLPSVKKAVEKLFLAPKDN